MNPADPPQATFPLPPPRIGPVDAAAGLEQTVWPYVLSGVSMAMAAEQILTLVAWVLQLAFYVLVSGGRGGMSGIFGGFPTSVWGAVQVGHRVVCALLGGVLLAAAWLLYRRRRLAPLLCTVYAIPAILVAPAFPVAYIASCPRQVMPQVVFWPIWSSTVSLALPVFLMVWLNRARIRQETRTWR